jgi:hypothetical protein
MMKDPQQHQLEFWERAALVGLDAILATENDCMTAEAAEMAAMAADALLVEWRKRFKDTAEGAAR